MAEEDNLYIRNQDKDNVIVDEANRSQSYLYNESNFTQIEQPVEKTEIDHYGKFFEHDRVKGDLHFVGELKNFNIPLIKNSWINNDAIDLLELPK